MLSETARSRANRVRRANQRVVLVWRIYAVHARKDEGCVRAVTASTNCVRAYGVHAFEAQPIRRRDFEVDVLDGFGLVGVRRDCGGTARCSLVELAGESSSCGAGAGDVVLLSRTRCQAPAAGVRCCCCCCFVCASVRFVCGAYLYIWVCVPCNMYARIRDGERKYVRVMSAKLQRKINKILCLRTAARVLCSVVLLFVVVQYVYAYAMEVITRARACVTKMVVLHSDRPPHK